jgi:prophage DNA circulation protein
MSWLDFLLPASWRGVPFQVFDNEARVGRKVALHEYPFRDTPWPEDMGKASSFYTFRGFLVGDDCYLQQDLLMVACEISGAGPLVHPTLGLLSVSLAEPAVFRQSYQTGRAVMVDLVFVEGAPLQLFPSVIQNTISNVSSAADSALTGISTDFSNLISNPLGVI